MTAGWRLDQIFSTFEQDKGGRPNKLVNQVDRFPSKSVRLKKLGVTLQTAMMKERIGKLPKLELDKQFKRAEAADILTTYDELVHLLTGLKFTPVEFKFCQPG
jgi:hypothetical protein